MKHLRSYLHLFFGLLVLGLAAFSGVEPAVGAEFHLLASGQQKVIDEHGVCRIVTNTSGQTIYIPTKAAAEWSSFYNTASGSVTAPPCAGCTLDGATVAHGASRTFYLTTRSCFATCGSVGQTRNCYNGVLDGSATYSKASCPSPTCASCTTASVNWLTSSFTCSASASGGSHGTTRNVSDGAAPNVGSASFNCSNGSWNQNSGSCSGASCTLPWGGSINHGQSATAYQTSSVACGSTCTSQSRTCNNGSLSGSYTNQSCSVSPCASCPLPWGGSINHGQSATAYQSASVPCGSSCNSQNRTCNNGSLSGSYSNASCSVGACGCTLPWGGSINHGQSVTAYQASSVPCGNSCTSQNRSCNNGSLSGSYANSSCSVGSCGCTTSGGVFIAAGTCKTLWNQFIGSNTSECGGPCESQTACCSSSGTLTGNTSYISGFCSTQPCCGNVWC